MQSLNIEKLSLLPYVQITQQDIKKVQQVTNHPSYITLDDFQLRSQLADFTNFVDFNKIKELGAKNAQLQLHVFKITEAQTQLDLE
ncbi:hypothetical protein SS50377_23553 [Spironucleus salmonicida]|uniref:Uncharacterized protein n=1 Tax=Spironucleus salmonicida TaxID=348837 RepID=V6LVB4_9EUKA|nr:hypothetical protein SS50377_23553 [Spironucleus salmonicida]|eukprot:EST48535.1 Hypothetical protein SS50377_11146 [Spironucleus salmonicida]